MRIVPKTVYILESCQDSRPSMFSLWKRNDKHVVQALASAVVAVILQDVSASNSMLCMFSVCSGVCQL